MAAMVDLCTCCELLNRSGANAKLDFEPENDISNPQYT